MKVKDGVHREHGSVMCSLCNDLIRTQITRCGVVGDNDAHDPVIPKVVIVV